MLNDYLDSIQRIILKGDAREESYYASLEELFMQFANTNGKKSIDITVLPKKTEAGNPDFRIWDGKNHITGYIEAKDPSVTNLDRVEVSVQLMRYRTTFPNVILTNFFEFRLYRNGELIKSATIGRQTIAKKLKVTPPVENEDKFSELLNTFFSFSLPHVRTSKSLAEELAKRTRFLRDEVVSIEIAEGESNGNSALLGFYDAFKTYLIGTLTEKSFADLYSQTITYGLFAARSRASDGFNRELAFKYIPNTIGILRDIFRFISIEDPPKPLQLIVDDIAEVLNVTDVNQILREYYSEGKGEDPIVHFYETFLTEYDPNIREKRGVYYTPEPVVQYIVNAVNQLLKLSFQMPDGLANEGVTLLDPAGGTLTFPAEAIKLAVKEYTEKYGSGTKANLIKNHILKNFYAFELMMAPYAIGHLKMSFLLEEMGYKLEDNERFKLYLTNTLEMDDLQQVRIPGLSSLSEESHLAGKVKKEHPVLVIIGNPPYSGISANTNHWTERLLKQNLDGATSYYEVDSKPLGEKKLWLQDDYVKFLRFAQWKIHKAGKGIVGMITNHGYLENPTFRGMRQSLMNTFNQIYIIDLHGNSLKREKTPEGAKDENVFDIRQGTAIALFVKEEKKKGCEVFHIDLFGSRNSKFDWLNNKIFDQNNYERLKPESPFYFFVSRNIQGLKKYLKWKSIAKIFPVNVAGIVTARDNFVIDVDRTALRNRLLQFKNLKQTDEIIEQAYSLKDTRGWKLSQARINLVKDDEWENYFNSILFRPFDVRHVYYSPKLIDWGRFDIMHHMLEVKGNLGLALSKRVEGGNCWEHAFITDKLITHHSVSMKEVNYLFPLFLTKEKPKRKASLQSFILFEPEVDYGDRIPNIDKSLISRLEKVYQETITPSDILGYVYAILYCNIYRQKYSDFLRVDFPRIPFTANHKVFAEVSQLGNQLIDLHLLRGTMLETPSSRYQGETQNDRIEWIQYNDVEGKIYINDDKYFDGVSKDVWEYSIGGNMILHKYLKDRKGKNLDNPKIFCQIIEAITKTLEVQSSIDLIYDEVERETIDEI